MAKYKQRPRKRPRPLSPAAEPCPASASAPASATSAAARPQRQIPGFVWDADKGRYFPATNRSADSAARRDERRETSRVQRIATIQQQPEPLTYSPPALPLLLRLRSAIQAPILCSERLRFASMEQSSRELYTSEHSPVSAVSLASNGMQAIVGHRDGFVSSVSLDSDSRPAVTETHARGPGETVSIRRIADRYICANLGDGYSEGGMVSIAGSSRLQYAGCSVFAASGPPACGPPRTAVGLTNRASVAVIDNARIAEVFNAHTKTDILSTTFAMSSCHVFLGGGRDGRARLFDTRVSSKQHDCRRGLLSAPLTSKSSIHGIGAHGWRLAAASMDSRVRMWDIRFAGTEWGDESSSAQSKSYSTDDCFGDLHRPLEMLSATRLGFAVCRDLVAAAGGENQIRIWSMNTGGIVRTVALPPSATGCSAIDLALTSAGMPLLLYSQLGTVVCLRAPLAR